MYNNNYSNSDLRKLTKEDLVGNWGTAVLLAILLAVISGLLSQLFSIFNFSGASTSVVPPMTDTPDVLIPYVIETMETSVKTSSVASLITSVLIAIFNLGIDFGFLDTVDGNSLELEHLISGFNSNLGKNILVVVISQLIISIGMILIIPGIIFSYILLPVPFLLKDYPDLEVTDILKKSKDLMKGHKFNFFKAALPFYLIPVGIFVVSTILLGVLLSQESFALGILLFAIGILAGIVASFWADIKVKVLRAGYYRRILNPIPEYDDEDDFIDFEDISVDRGGVYVDTDSDDDTTDYDDSYSNDRYTNNNEFFSYDDYDKSKNNDIIEDIIMSDDEIFTSEDEHFDDDIYEDPEEEYTDTEFMEDMILLGEQDLLFGDNGDNKEDQ